jgi:hypothetical protein
MIALGERRAPCPGNENQPPAQANAYAMPTSITAMNVYRATIDVSKLANEERLRGAQVSLAMALASQQFGYAVQVRSGGRQYSKGRSSLQATLNAPPV